VGTNGDIDGEIVGICDEGFKVGVADGFTLGRRVGILEVGINDGFNVG
jgi:hypothetical protein